MDARGTRRMCIAFGHCKSVESTVTQQHYSRFYELDARTTQ